MGEEERYGRTRVELNGFLAFPDSSQVSIVQGIFYLKKAYISS